MTVFGLKTRRRADRTPVVWRSRLGDDRPPKSGFLLGGRTGKHVALMQLRNARLTLTARLPSEAKIFGSGRKWGEERSTARLR